MSENKKALLVVNPKSGKDKTRPDPMMIVEKLSKAGYDFSVRKTTCAGDATNIVKEAGEGYDLIVCCGGDGTLNEVINGVMHLNRRPKIGYIPTGSTNDLASTMGIPTDVNKAMDLIINGKTYGYDIGMFNNKFYTYVASFGTGVDISYDTPQALKNIFGHNAYVINGFVLKLGHNIRNIKPLHARFEYDDGVIDDNFFFGAVSNSTSVAGIFKYNEDEVRVDDGVFEVLLVRKLKSVLDAFAMFGKIKRREYDGDTLIYLRTKTAKFTFDEPTPWTLDGEDGGKVKDINISVLNRAVEIYSNDTKMFIGDVAQPTFVREEKERKIFRRKDKDDAQDEESEGTADESSVIETAGENAETEVKEKKKFFGKKDKDEAEEAAEAADAPEESDE